jgi:thymidylate kinase
MKHVPFFLKRFFLSFFPKPSLTFYLYNDPNTLYNRKRDQSPEELSRQMGLFEQLSNNFEANNVKTDNKELNLNAIVTKTLSFLNK